MTKKSLSKKEGKLSRRFGCNIWGRSKNPFVIRNSPPGMHGSTGYKNKTDYGMQFNAKQLLKEYYMMCERQFSNLFKKALNKKGDTSENIIGLLESRLDAFVYRSTLLPTLASARQFVSHGHLTVNGLRVNIPSYTLRVGDVVMISDKTYELKIIQESINKGDRRIPEYIELDQRKAKYLYIPSLSDVPYPINISLDMVVGFYSM